MNRRPSARRRALAMLAAGAALFVSAAVARHGAAVEPGQTLEERAPVAYRAEVRWTAHGIPHIKADDFAGLGFGTGYAYAVLNACVLAEIVVTIRGERSRYFGSQGGNLASDLFYRRLIDEGVAERLLDGDPETGFAPSEDARALMRGFAAGYNRYLRETGVDRIPDPTCRGGEWVREIDELDLWRRTAAGPTTMLQAIVAARPPDGAAPAGDLDALMLPADAEFLALASGDLALDEGSNAWALGRDVTGGRAVLLGNPHYPWTGFNRFYRLHQTIPGVLDVTGATLMGNPVVGIGHTDAIAWTHTVSTARRYTLYELELVPGDPTSYLYDGEPRPMARQEVAVEVRLPDGSLEERRHTFHRTHFGPVVATDSLPWTTGRAYAIRTADSGLRAVDQRLAWFRAPDVYELRYVLLDYLAVGFNTIAVDRNGNALYGDVGAIPHVTDAMIEACVTSPVARETWRRSRIAVLDGSRSECEWGRDASAVAPGLFGAEHLPLMIRSDYTANMNNSYWLTNPRSPLTGLPRILGEEESDIGLRARLGLLMLEERLLEVDGARRGFDLELVQQLMFNNRHLGGELVRDDLVAHCADRPVASVDGETIDLTDACLVLADWDLRVEVDSRGAHLFREFARAGGLRFAVAFQLDDPIHTPRTLDREDPRVLAALGRAVQRLEATGIPLDARLGEVQYRVCGTERVPIHGGPGGEGVFNAITAPFVEPEGYPAVVSGASFVMVVAFTDAGPVSRAILTYSQSTENPESPYACDQTWLYSEKSWLDMKFSEAAILADPELRVQVVTEDAGDCRDGGWAAFGRPGFRSEAQCVAYFEGGGAPAPRR